MCVFEYYDNNQVIMSTPAQRRLVQDIQRIRKNQDNGMDASPDSDNLLLW